MAKKQKKGATNLLEVQNAAKTMFANIRFQSIDKPIKSILLTSTVPDEGKTTSLWYLAQAAATAGHSVLIVEGDMRRRTLASMLQIHPQNGVFAVLSGNVTLKEAVVPTKVRNLYFLDSEAGIPNPADLLASRRMKKLNEELCKAYDYVIYDTPPVGTFVDAAVLGSLVDASILVVRPGSAKRSELVVAYEQMRNAGANVIGICSTFVEGTGSEYYYSYYTKDKSKRGVTSVAAEMEEKSSRFELADELMVEASTPASTSTPTPAAARPADKAGISVPRSASLPGQGASGASNTISTPRSGRVAARQARHGSGAKGASGKESSGAAAPSSQSVPSPKAASGPAKGATTDGKR